MNTTSVWSFNILIKHQHNLKQQHFHFPQIIATEETCWIMGDRLVFNYRDRRASWAWGGINHQRQILMAIAAQPGDHPVPNFSYWQWESTFLPNAEYRSITIATGQNLPVGSQQVCNSRPDALIWCAALWEIRQELFTRTELTLVI